jgi:F-box and leucine-rich repeat protein 2/20
MPWSFAWIEILMKTGPVFVQTDKKSVDLSHCVGAGDREVAALAAAAGLRELRLDKCLGVTDMGLAKVVVGCPRLEKLGVKWCREISDIGVDLLAKKCPELRSLDISYLEVNPMSN